MDSNDIQNRFEYHPPVSDERKGMHETVRFHCREMAHTLNSALPEGREKSTAITKLEEVMFWANAALARQPD